MNDRDKALNPVDKTGEIHRFLAETPYPKSLLDDYARIISVLTPKVITENLKKLETELQKSLAEKGKLEVSGDKAEVVKKPNKAYVPHFHVLTEYINKWALENGFNTGRVVSCIEKNEKGIEERVNIRLPNKSPVIFDFLPQHIFIAIILALGYLAKDLGAGVQHGEFTHFLQIFSFVEENKKHPYLENDPAALINAAGNFVLIDILAWQIIFDAYSDRACFNNPDFFNADLNELRSKLSIFSKSVLEQINIKEFPILTSLIQGRSDKRKSLFRTFPSSPMFEFPFLEEKTKEKYLTKNGLIINDAIYFDTGEKENRHVIFDDVSRELKLYREVIGNKSLPKPTVNSTLSPLDQLITLFDPNTILLVDTKSQEMFSKIRTGLIKAKDDSTKPGKILHLRDIVVLLEPLVSNLIKIKAEDRPGVESAIMYTLDQVEALNFPTKKPEIELSESPRSKI